MALDDVRGSVPANVLSVLQDDEKVYFYGSGSGCLGGSKSYVLVTNERVVGSAITDP